MCLPNILFPVFMFTVAHFYLAGRSLLGASISHSHRRFKFPCFSSYEIRLLCFQYLALALSLLSKLV